MPSFTVKSWWGDQTQLGGYEGYGRGHLSSSDVNASEARALNADEADVVGQGLAR